MTKILSRSTSATMSRSHRERSLGLRCAAVELKIVTYTANTVQYESKRQCKRHHTFREIIFFASSILRMICGSHSTSLLYMDVCMYIPLTILCWALGSLSNKTTSAILRRGAIDNSAVVLTQTYLAFTCMHSWYMST